MSTHAAIALKMSPTCIRWIYLHCDGDLRFAGRTLANYYLTYEKVRQKPKTWGVGTRRGSSVISGIYMGL